MDINDLLLQVLKGKKLQHLAHQFTIEVIQDRPRQDLLMEEIQDQFLIPEEIHRISLHQPEVLNRDLSSLHLK